MSLEKVMALIMQQFWKINEVVDLLSRGANAKPHMVFLLLNSCGDSSLLEEKE